MVSKQKVANGVFWVEVPEADLRILCGSPADAVKHLIRRGLVAPTEKGGVSCETGPNAILLSDTPIQKGSFANLCEFPLLQMFYRQGMVIPNHPNNTGRRPLLIGLGDQVRSQAEYFMRGNYGLVSVEELEACGASAEEARELFEIKKWFSFGHVHSTTDLVDVRPVDAETVDLAPGCVLHRKGFNRYEFLAGGQAVEVDLSLGPAEEFEPAWTLPAAAVRRDEFSVIHIGEGDGWDPGRPCMGSIVCGGGRLYLVDAGPHLTRSLDALGIGLTEIDGIFHTHAHDDHFSGLTALVRSDRRLKYYAAPCVRASVQKKLAALMRTDEERFSSFFDVHDLQPGQWNTVGSMEVRPVYSPHPVETTVLFFRAGHGGEKRTYAHLADIASVEVVNRLCAAPAGGAGAGPAPMSEARRQAFLREIHEPVDLKKVDAGGGLIHGEARDFEEDRSRRMLLSHGVPVSPTRAGAATAGPGTAGSGTAATTAGFGETDVLIAGGSEDYFRQTARACLQAWYPKAGPDEIESLVRSPIVQIPRGELVHPRPAPDSDIRIILGGVAEETDAAARTSHRVGLGSVAGGWAGGVSPAAPSSCRARGTVTVLSIPSPRYRPFVQAHGPIGRVSSLRHDALALCPAFAGTRSEGVVNHVAAEAEERGLAAGEVALAEVLPGILVLAAGEVDLAVGTQLIETLGPGGFWGEERIVSRAPSLATARAVTDCTLLAIPAGAIADIPSVQWVLLETFERRLRSLRARFRFEWSQSFCVNVKQLDDEHRELFARVNALSHALGTSGQLEGHEVEKTAVIEYARLHFHHEETLMERHAYPRLGVQKRAHEMLMRQLERLAGAEEKRARPRVDTAADYLKDWLISHTLLEDLQYRDFFAGRGIS